MIHELDRVILAVDLPGLGLQAGDLGTVVLVHRDGVAFEVEFMTLDGETIDVVTLTRGQVRPIDRGEIAHARPVGPVAGLSDLTPGPPPFDRDPTP